jgi:protein SCO1/2
MMKAGTKAAQHQGAKQSGRRLVSLRTVCSMPRCLGARLPVVVVAAIAIGATSTFAQRDFAADVPPELVGVGVDEKLGEMVPLDAEFRDEAGVRVTFRELLADGKPTIVTPVFYNCPMLCTQVLNGLTDGMSKLEWSAGEEFNIITYSFNPEETPKLAAAKRDIYLGFYERPSARQGWRFLTGSPESVNAMNDALGIRTRRTEDGLYAHTAAIVFITPQGRIARYMNDVMFKERDLRFALVEASEGTIGSPMDQFLLMMCYQYNPDKNSFTPSAWKIMRGGGALTAVLLAGGLSFMWLRDFRRRHLTSESGHTDADETGNGATHAR